jgi:uncharacterized protein (DUF433 family)
MESSLEGAIMSTATPAKSWIQKRDGVCGGAACLRETRITVWGLAAYRRLGLDDAEIMRRVAGLTHADLTIAWAYCADHADEIEQDIRDNEGD